MPRGGVQVRAAPLPLAGGEPDQSARGRGAPEADHITRAPYLPRRRAGADARGIEGALDDCVSSGRGGGRAPERAARALVGEPRLVRSGGGDNPLHASGGPHGPTCPAEDGGEQGDVAAASAGGGDAAGAPGADA